MKTIQRTGVIRGNPACVLALTTAILPFKGMAEEPIKQTQGRLLAGVHQKGRQEYVGFGIAQSLQIRRFGIDGSFAFGLAPKPAIEDAEIDATLHISQALAITSYAYGSRYYGVGNAYGGAVHLWDFHAGIERDDRMVTPAFAFYKIGLGERVALVPKVMKHLDTSNLGGELRIEAAVDGISFFLRGFTMTNPAAEMALALEGQAGVSFPLR